jgi:hypothetical protein
MYQHIIESLAVGAICVGWVRSDPAGMALMT